MTFLYNYSSPLGEITMAGEENALTGLWLEGQKYFAAALPDNAEYGKLPVFDETVRWLDIYFSGKEPDFDLPLLLRGSRFRMIVWEILRTIPYGCTMTYGQIASKAAEKLGIKRMSPQAVGGAVGHNPVSIIIPCHRVVGSDGSLTGYAGGIEKRIELLKLEKVDMTKLFNPSLPQKNSRNPGLTAYPLRTPQKINNIRYRNSTSPPNMKEKIFETGIF